MVKLFCERLKALRLEKNLSQPELAKLINVSNGIISFWENGVNEPTITNLIKLSKLFDVSTDYLVGLED